ncbi:metallophosphoesterase family protein [Desulfonatronum thiodismutans]|uniref:metallophosphoesterase family protein n=1 Tax=Desulfonatronum thiodismutans TaxID=159290 RepID=UPI00068E3F2B|nr:metallophosphoesterase [Desulfonatronum thiodismutans]
MRKSVPRILLAGDTHGCFTHVLEAGKAADVVILLGDQTPKQDLQAELGKFAEKTWFLLGNHDSDKREYLLRHQSMMDRCLHRKRIDFGGIRIAGLNGVFRTRYVTVQKDTRLHEMDRETSNCKTRQQYTQRHGNIPKLATSIFAEDIKALAKLRADVLVTHEAPQTHRYGFQLIGDLAQAMGVKLLVHAHHHERYEADIAGKIRVLGLGMPTGYNSRQGLAWLDDQLQVKN